MNNTAKVIISVASLSTLVFIIYNSVQRNKKTPHIYFLKDIKKNYNARTIPPFGIYIKESEKGNNELLEHELIHWKQYQEKGLLNYYLNYFQEMKKFGYDKMPMEKQARKNESEYCKENYTECVRNGKSNTIYNPNFRA